MSQCYGQNPEPIVVENLVIHFDQEKFEELLSGGSPVLHARKHRKVFVAKASVATEQKSALTMRANGQTSLQLLSTEAKSASRKTSLSKQVWSAKQKAPRKASGEVPA